MKRFFLFALMALAVLVNAQATTWNLDNCTTDVTMRNGDVLIGEIQPGVAINVTIAAGAKVTFNNAHVIFTPSGSGQKAKAAPSVNCLGDAEITIVGNDNKIINSNNGPGIYIPSGKKLKIYGTDADSIYIKGGIQSAAIGAYHDVDAGSIQINGGKIEAHGGYQGAGIGGAHWANCGAIDIYGGKVKAYGGDRSTGIGSGFDSSQAGYVNITSMEGTSTTVYAEGGYRAPGIGGACLSTCGFINISGPRVNVTAVKGTDSPCTIGWGFGCTKSHVGNITIGGQTYANGVDRSYFNYPNVHDIDLSKMHSDFTMQDGDILTGTLGNDMIRVMVADGAHVTLRNANIPELLGKGSNCGIECLGNAEITLEGTNEIWHRGGAYYPAIFYPENKTLDIKGNGKLIAHGGGYSAGIGTGACTAKGYSSGLLVFDPDDKSTCLNKWAGNLNIYSGTIEAYGGNNGPGIGSARHAHCGMIQILGGKVTAIGGNRAPGIGAAAVTGNIGEEWATGTDHPTVCGVIRLSGGTVYAQAGSGYAPAIGGSDITSLCDKIYIANTLTKLTAVKGDFAPKCIASPKGEGEYNPVYIASDTYAQGIDFSPYYYPDSKVINLSEQNTNISVPDGYTLTGKLAKDYMVEIEDGAEVILDGVEIDNDGESSNAPAANRAPKGAAVNMNKSGIMLQGNATLRLRGETTVRSKGDGCPGIYVPSGKVLEIKGDGVMNVYGGRTAAGIGGGLDVDAGHILIEDHASVNAYGGNGGAGIGGGYWSNCGDIIITTDGTVNATGGQDGTGIGSGYDSSHAGKIIIQYGSVNATGDGKSPAIGAGCMSTCGMIYLYSTIRSLKAVKGNQADHSIGKGYGRDSQHGGIAMDDKFYSRGIDVSPYLYPNNVIDLATVNSDFTAYHGAILTGKLKGAYKISIEDGATITLRNAEIMRYAQTNDMSNYWPGITCKGKAIIKLEGTNTVMGMDRNDPAIYVPENKTLFIQGPGTLYAHSQGAAASIGAGVGKPCGNIEIQGGRVEAYNLDSESALYGAGIGGSTANGSALGKCGNIIITGGTVVARGNSEAPGIGTGANGYLSADKKIYILGGIVYAYGGKDAPAIGAGWGSQIGGVEISEDVEFLRAEAGEGAVYSIGKSMIRPDKVTKCGPVKVEDEVYTEGIIDEVFYYPSEAAYLRYRAPKTIKLDTLANWPKLVLVNGDKITGTLPKAMFVSIVKGATVTFENVTINGVNDAQKNYAGVTCEGDAVIQLVGANTVKGNDSQYPAFFVPEGATLQFGGSGSLTANSWGLAPAIGGKLNTNCGNILLASGTFDLEGGVNCPAIGSIQNYGCGNITIEDGVNLTATKGAMAPYTIGPAKYGTCQVVRIGNKTGEVNVSPYYFPEQYSYDPYLLDLSTLTNDRHEVYVQTENTVITGTLPAGVKVQIYIQDRSIQGVTLRNVTINGTNSSDAQYAGLTLTGTNIIRLEGTNTIRGFYKDYPGIYVNADARLIIYGPGTLNVSSNGNAPAIGGTRQYGCGAITIKGGTINATGGTGCPAIGAAPNKKVWSNIELMGGTIYATGGLDAPAIGAGRGGEVYNVVIHNSITKLRAAKGSGSTYCIGTTADPSKSYVTFAGQHYYPANIQKSCFGTENVFTYDPTQTSLIKYSINDGATLWGDFSNFELTAPENVSFTLDYFTYNQTGNSVNPAIKCYGGNTIALNDEGKINMIGVGEPGIWCAANKTITIKAKNVNYQKEFEINSKYGPAIGASNLMPCGNIIIESGVIKATGGAGSPAIGGYAMYPCGDITIKGGTLTLKGGKNAPAIGASANVGGNCGAIKLYNTITSLEATAGEGALYSVGRSELAECGTISLYDNGESATPEVIENGIEQNPFIYPRSAGLSVRRLLNLEYLEGEVNERIRIAPDAVVTFSDVTIGGQEGYDYHEPGVYCEGNAGIILMGHSTVQSFNPNYPGIYVPEGSTLVLYALVGSTDAALDATCKGTVARVNMLKKVNGRFVPADDSNPKMAAGIGGYIDANGKPKNCGNILINGANITATGGAGHPGIGGGTLASCGTITINGGSVLAIGGPEAPGIGAGTSGSCGAIRLTNQVTRVEARAGEGAQNSVGFANTDAEAGMESSCNGIIVGSIEYGEGITDPIFIYEPTDEERKEDIEIVNGNAQTNDGKIYKVMINGQLLIINGNQIYTITGQRVK